MEYWREKGFKMLNFSKKRLNFSKRSLQKEFGVLINGNKIFNVFF